MRSDNYLRYTACSVFEGSVWEQAIRRHETTLMCAPRLLMMTEGRGLSHGLSALSGAGAPQEGHSVTSGTGTNRTGTDSGAQRSQLS